MDGRLGHRVAGTVEPFLRLKLHKSFIFVADVKDTLIGDVI